MIVEVLAKSKLWKEYKSYKFFTIANTADRHSKDSTTENSKRILVHKQFEWKSFENGYLYVLSLFVCK